MIAEHEVKGDVFHTAGERINRTGYHSRASGALEQQTFLRAEGRVVCIQRDNVAARLAGLRQRAPGRGDELDVLPPALAIGHGGGGAARRRHAPETRVPFGLPLALVERAKMVDLDHDDGHALALARATPPFALEKLL